MILRYNLQFFAKDGPGGERTEPATAKKLRDARKKGQVAKSKEVANGICLLALFLMLKIWIGNTGNSLMEIFPSIYNRIPEFSKNYNGFIPVKSLMYSLQTASIQVILIALPFMLVGFVLCFVSDLFQVKWSPTNEPLKPKFNKLNPVSGFKRIFSLSSLVELLKSLLKIGIIGLVSYSYLQDKWKQLYVLYGISLKQANKS